MIFTLFSTNSWLIYLFLALYSLCIGSLLNLVIYRIPIMLHNEWHAQCSELGHLNNLSNKNSINLFFPRSFCPQCHQSIKAWQNIPLISYLLLRGKCHYCHLSIPIRYPLIELSTMLLSLYCFWHFGLTWQFLYALIAIWLLIVLFFIDIDHQLLPDSMTLSLLWLGLIANCFSLFTSLPNAVLSTVGAYLFLWLFIRIFYLITGKIGMGNGDFKLFAAFGAWFGWMYLPFILLCSSLSGALIGSLYLYFSKQSKDTTIPFGPFLCLSGLLTLFYGKCILNSYLNLYPNMY